MTAFLFYYCNNSSLLYSVQIRFPPWFPYNSPCHQFSVPAEEIDISPRPGQWACLFPTSQAHCTWACPSRPSPPWFTEILSSYKQILAQRPPFPTALPGAETWVSVRASILQQTRNWGVRDSNSDCCSQVYLEIGREAIYLLDLKLATHSHQWDSVSCFVVIPLLKTLLSIGQIFLVPKASS